MMHYTKGTYDLISKLQWLPSGGHVTACWVPDNQFASMAIYSISHSCMTMFCDFFFLAKPGIYFLAKPAHSEEMVHLMTTAKKIIARLGESCG